MKVDDVYLPCDLERDDTKRRGVSSLSILESRGAEYPLDEYS
jgi:hypothetical protein